MRAAAFVLYLLLLAGCAMQGTHRSATDIPASGPEQVPADATPRGPSKLGELTIVGNVHDSCKRPIEGARIIVFSADNQACFLSCKTDRTGCFVVQHLNGNVSHQVHIAVEEKWCEAFTTTKIEATEQTAINLAITFPAPCCQKDHK